MKAIILNVLLVILFAVCFTACSGSSAEYEMPKDRVIEKQKTINKSYDIVWQEVVDWFAFHNSPIKTLDKNSGLIASDYNLSVEQTKEYIDCGKVISGQTNAFGVEVTFMRYENPKGNFNILIKKIDETSTKVTINFFSESELNQYNRQGSQVYSQKVTCVSKGILEKEIFDAISK